MKTMTIILIHIIIQYFEEFLFQTITEQYCYQDYNPAAFWKCPINIISRYFSGENLCLLPWKLLLNGRKQVINFLC